MKLGKRIEKKKKTIEVSKNFNFGSLKTYINWLAAQGLHILYQVRKEYEMLRIEFEQNLAVNEQTGPINKEMRNLITTLQAHNSQLKGDVARLVKNKPGVREKASNGNCRNFKFLFCEVSKSGWWDV